MTVLVRDIPPGGSASAALHPHLWGIVLSGSDDPMGAEYRARRAAEHAGRHRRRADVHPERPGLFRRAVDRATRLIDPERMVAVLTREHSLAYEAELRFAPAVHRVLQPRYRGTAAEVFLPVLQIARRDPHAVVAVLPGDQRVDLEARFMSYVARAALAASLRPDLLLLIGTHPSVADSAAPWIEPGGPVDGVEHLGVRAVVRFIRRPSRRESQMLFEGAGLHSTGVLVAKAHALLAVGHRYLPEVLETLEPLEDAFDAPEEPLLREAIYECMPYASIAGEILERGRDFGVLPVPDVMWRGAGPPEAELLAS